MTPLPGWQASCRPPVSTGALVQTAGHTSKSRSNSRYRPGALRAWLQHHEHPNGRPRDGRCCDRQSHRRPGGSGLGHDVRSCRKLHRNNVNVTDITNAQTVEYSGTGLNNLTLAHAIPLGIESVINFEMDGAGREDLDPHPTHCRNRARRREYQQYWCCFRQRHQQQRAH